MMHHSIAEVGRADGPPLGVGDGERSIRPGLVGAGEELSLELQDLRLEVDQEVFDLSGVFALGRPSGRLTQAVEVGDLLKQVVLWSAHVRDFLHPPSMRPVSSRFLITCSYPLGSRTCLR